MWRTRGGYEIYYENDKWIFGNGPYGPYGPNEKYKYFISDSSDECPESVESWSDSGMPQGSRIQIGGINYRAPNGFTLGKIECGSTL